MLAVFQIHSFKEMKARERLHVTQVATVRLKPVVLKQLSDGG